VGVGGCMVGRKTGGVGIVITESISSNIMHRMMTYIMMTSEVE
jgi:hypothetical protein